MREGLWRHIIATVLEAGSYREEGTRWLFAAGMPYSGHVASLWYGCIVTLPPVTNRPAPGVLCAAAAPWWLRLSAPLGVLGLIAAAVGAIVDGAYRGMTPDWARQTYAQDLADLFVGFPLVVVLALFAARGSVRALIAWLGVVIATLYTYVIYAFDVPFGHLYLANVALLGLSGWAFGGALAGIDRRAIRERFDDDAPRRTTGWALIAIAVLFYVTWLAEDVPATLRGVAPASLQEVGLMTNPVHVLDLAFLLPACMLSGLGLVRGRTWAYLFAPALMLALATISVGIVTIMVVAIADGESALVPVAAVMTLAGLAQIVLAVRFLQHLR